MHLPKLRRLYLAPLLLLLVFLSMSIPALQAQDDGIVISLAVPEYLSDAFTDEILAQFESENPGVKIHVVESGDEGYYPPAAYDVDGYLQGAEKYISSADVLYVNSYNFSVEGTRAGYFLDLTPLINSDASFDTDDFLPPVWQSCQWDDGIWALPISASVQIMAYKPKAFDEAGLTYPTEDWTVDDFINAVRALAKKDADGKIIQPGFQMFGGNGLLLRSFLQQGFYDVGTQPNTPLFTDPALVDLLTTWAEVEKDGSTGRDLDFSSYDYNNVPLRIDQSYILDQPTSDPADQWVGVLLPGGTAGLSVEAFAVSGATEYPDQAYALAKFLTGNIDVISRFYSDTPARKSLIGTEGDNSVSRFTDRSPEETALMQQALDHALPVSETRFGEYVMQAIDKMVTDGVDAQAALEEVEATAVQNLQTAEAKRGTSIVSVATPVPTPVLGAGEVALNFGMTAFFSPLPNRDLWDQAIADFVASDPQVRQIVFDAGFGGSLTDLTQSYDCFYMPYNLVPTTDDLSLLLPLDPFMSADPDFDKDDVVGNTMAQLQKDDQTWAYPVVIQPQVLSYNKELFDKANLTYPTSDWTVDQFRDALQQLKPNPDDPPPFQSTDFGGNHLLILMASYGGLPLDYRTSPITANFTDPASVDAIRQVLDLAKEGYIKYQKLGDFTGGGGGFNSNIPISTQSLSLASFYTTGQQSPDTANPYGLTPYPRGNQFSGLSYDIGTAYISAQAQNPEACYRWISTFAKRADLFSSMPARRSQINDPALASAQGQDIVDVYNDIDTILQDPNTVTLPSQYSSGGGSPGDFVIQLWLYRVFDKYVLDTGNGDLEADLTEAQSYADAYKDCIASIPPNTLGRDATQEEQTAYFKQFTDCAVNIDTSLKTLFNIE